MNEWFFLLVGALLAELLALIRSVTGYDAPLRRRYQRWRQGPHLTARDWLELGRELLPLIVFLVGLIALEAVLVIEVLVPQAKEAEVHDWAFLGALVGLYALAEVAERAQATMRRLKEENLSAARLLPFVAGAVAILGGELVLLTQLVIPNLDAFEVDWVWSSIVAGVILLGLLASWIYRRRQRNRPSEESPAATREQL